MQRQMEDRRAPNQIFYHVNGSSDSVRFSGVGGRRVGEAVVGFAAAIRGVLRRINAKLDAADAEEAEACEVVEP